MSPREVGVGPEAPGDDALVDGQRPVRGADGGVYLRADPHRILDLGRAGGVGRLSGLGQKRGAGRQHDRLDSAGQRFDHHRVADPGDAQGVLDVLGVHVQAVRQDDDVLLAAHQDQVPRGVVPADVACLVPAVGREGTGRDRRIAPVAAEESRPRHEHFAVVGELHLNRRDRPSHRPEAVVALVRG